MERDMRHVLWTGGWDSTYRVLDLVIIKSIDVQPYYIIDEQRSSTKKELETMELIKEELFNIDNKYESCIKKTVFIHKKEIPRNNEITAAYNRLRQISFIGSQYDWLARYMWSAGIKLDLSVH